MPADLKNPELTRDEIRAQCDRILASPQFSRSKRLCDFLSYVVDAALEGRENKLGEYSVGIDVFQRDESFDPAIDSIVRVEASRLRSKLREYYGESTPSDTVKIEIPKGRYKPFFSPIQSQYNNRGGVTRIRFLNRKSVPVIFGVIIAAIGYFIVGRTLSPLSELDNVDLTEGRLESPSLIHERSIAVLPFQSRSADSSDVYFADGMHDDILTQLSKLSFLEKVISRTSMEQYRDTAKPMSEISAELGVKIILEGSVQRSGERVRINMQLIDAVQDKHIWSETYDRELTPSNIFSIQSEIAAAIADAMRMKISPLERVAIGNVPTTNLDAYDLYQRAQQLRRTLGLGTRNEVAQLLEKAVSLDPDFALAQLALARAYLDRYFTSERDTKHRDLARVAIDKAFDSSPGMPESRIALADFYYKGFLDYSRALQQLDFAIPLAPGNSEAYAIRAFVLRRRGNLAKAIPDLSRAIELDPDNFSPHYVLANTYVILDQYAQSLPHYDRALELAPANFGLKILRAYALLSQDVNSPAMFELTQDPAFSDGSSAVEIAYRWEMALILGDYDLAMSIIDSHRTDIVVKQYAYYPLDLMRGLTESYIGDPAKSVGYFESARMILQSKVLEVPDDPRVISALGLAHAGLKDKENAIEFAARATALYPVSKDAVDGPLYVLNFARTYALVGESKLVLQKLDDLLSKPSNWYATPNVIARSPAFKKLWNDSAFVALIEDHRSDP